MNGPVALHGGGEFQAGDEPFLRRLLELAVAAAASRGATVGDPIRIVIVPTAAARGRPLLVGAHGTEAFERVAASTSKPPIAIRVEVVPVIDPASAADPGFVTCLGAADLIHLPGGEPDLIPSILPGTAAWAAILGAHRRGAVLAGASAGAMALAPWTWTPGGGMAGLDLVAGLVVAPHADPASWASAIERFRSWLPTGLGLLGVAERTGVISRPGSPGTGATGPAGWDVVGEGEARWLPPGADPASTLVVGAGGRLRLPGV